MVDGTGTRRKDPCLAIAARGGKKGSYSLSEKKTRRGGLSTGGPFGQRAQRRLRGEHTGVFSERRLSSPGGRVLSLDSNVRGFA